MDKQNNYQSETATVTFLLDEGQAMRAPVLRFSPHQVVFEIQNPTLSLRASEVLKDFRVLLGERVVATGRAVVHAFVNAGTALVCEATIEEAAWGDLSALRENVFAPDPRQAFAAFMRRASQSVAVSPEFKLMVADLQTMLHELRQWCDLLEFGLQSKPGPAAGQAVREIIEALRQPMTQVLNQLFERFEHAVQAVGANDFARHASYVRRQLHALLLCAPFLNRTYHKPLGYAGDYEMVNMIMRDPAEGGSLFAKMLNVWFLAQPPAQAHRNRVEYLAEQITAVTACAAAAGRQARIITLGCGPAWEVQRFLEEKDFSGTASFNLLDFNEETVERTSAILNEINRRHPRPSRLQLYKRSVNDVLKQSARKGGDDAGQFDFVYCAGLYDYLPDAVCRRLSTALYHWVAPGGLFVITNVDSSNPRRLTMDYVMDWHLIYRDGRGLCAVRPEQVSADDCRVVSDDTGVNIYLEALRPPQ